MGGTMDIAQDVIREQQRLAGERQMWDDHWQQIAARCCPRLAEFTTQPTPGARRTDQMFDSTASLAAENFAAAMAGMTAPRAQRWHGVRSGIPELDDRPAVKRYFETLSAALFYHRYAAAANFSNQYHEVQLSLGLFGCAPMWVDEVVGGGLLYRSIHVGQCFVEEDQHGRIGTVYQRFPLSARNAARRFGEDRLPPKMREALAAGKGWQEFEFIQAVRPNDAPDPARRDWRAMPIEEIVTLASEPFIVRQGGYRTMPIVVPRYTASSREPYGRSPAMQALPDIKMVNEMARTLMRGAHKAVDPPLAVPDDGVLTRLHNQPGKINVGGVNSAGNLMVQPIYSGSALPIGRDMLNDAREVINKAFLVPLFSILTETPDRMTATEVLERAKEKGILLSPAAGRIEAECLGPMIEREIDILAARGVLPEMPPELVEADGEYRITYDNPLTRAARSERSIGFLRTVEAVAPMAQQKPEVWDEFDIAAAVRGLAEDNAVPPSWMADPAKRQAEAAAQAEQAQMAALLEGADVASRAAANMAKAQSMAGAAPV